MKLLSLHIENFGKLKNFDYVFKDGLNTFCTDNGWGKTTLATFIKAMFFGMDKKGNLKPYAAERSKYMPWQGGIYGGSIVFEIGGKTYRVLRTFGPTPESDKFELVDFATGKATKDYSTNLGEEIFGIGKETFTLSTYFPQGMLEGDINDEVRSHLSGANQFAGDVEMHSRAVKNLKSLSRQLVVTSPKVYEIRDCENQIEDGKAALSSFQDKKEQAKEEVEQLKAQLKSLTKKNGEGSKQASQTLLDLNNKKHELENERKEYENTLKNRMSLGYKARFTLLLPLVLMLICTGIFVGLYFANGIKMNLGTLLAVIIALTVVMLVAYICYYSSLKKKSKQKRSEIDVKILELNKQELEIEKLIQAYREADSAKFEKFTEIAAKEKQLAVLENDIRHFDDQIGLLMETIDTEESKLDQMRTKKEELESKQQIVSAVIKFLEEAQENLSKRYVQPMQEKFTQIIGELSEDKSFRLDVDLNTNVDTQIGLKEKQYLSRGKQDLVDICKRFALIDSVFTKEKPFIVLDDPFINLDENVLSNMLKLISKFSQEFQIIYLICHNSRKM